MRHQVLQWAFVGIWEEPLAEPPEIERRFWLELFDDPYETVAGFTGPSRFQVTLPKGDRHPSVVIESHRIEFQAPNLDLLVRTYGQVMVRLAEKTDTDLGMKAVGLNTDQEWTELGVRGGDWLGERFVRGGLRETAGSREAEGLQVQFRLWAPEPQRRYQIKIEPRAGIEHGLFFHVNDHRERESLGQISRDQVEPLLVGSIGLLHDGLFSALGLEVEGD